jgi:hypothetical protein
MTSTTISPSIDQGQLQKYRDTFYSLMEQTKSRLVGAGVAMFMTSEGKSHNFARIGGLELDQVDGRNPDKQFEDYSVDNRQFSKVRFTKTVQIDAKDDINELLANPTSDLLQKLSRAKERVIDRTIVDAAVGSVKTGAPDAALTTVTAAADGVITVDASSGLTYEKILEVTQTFTNNEFEYSDMQGSVICVSGSENTDLMGEIEFINNDYINGKPVDAGFMDNAGLYKLVRFAGSDDSIIVKNPVLNEGSTLRKCVVLAPQSIAVAMELADLSVEKSATKVNSRDITIDFWIGAMRTEGVKVQILSTTI